MLKRKPKVAGGGWEPAHMSPAPVLGPQHTAVSSSQAGIWTRKWERECCLCFCPETITFFHLHKNIGIEGPAVISKMISTELISAGCVLIGFLLPIETTVLHRQKIGHLCSLCSLAPCVADLVHSFILQNITPARHWTWGLNRNHRGWSCVGWSSLCLTL